MPTWLLIGGEAVSERFPVCVKWFLRWIPNVRLTYDFRRFPPWRQQTGSGRLEWPPVCPTAIFYWDPRTIAIRRETTFATPVTPTCVIRRDVCKVITWRQQQEVPFQGWRVRILIVSVIDRVVLLDDVTLLESYVLLFLIIVFFAREILPRDSSPIGRRPLFALVRSPPKLIRLCVL